MSTDIRLLSKEQKPTVLDAFGSGVAPFVSELFVSDVEGQGHKRIRRDLVKQPVITSTLIYATSENSTIVGPVVAASITPLTLKYKITGGADADKFDLDAATGLLSFKVAPDFEVPGSSLGTNQYEVDIAAWNTLLTSQSATVTVNVVNVDELWESPTEIQLNSSDVEANSRYGFSTAVSGDGNTAIVTASVQDEPVGTDAGAAYAFIRSGNTWVFQQKITPSPALLSGSFGYFCALSYDGNTALIGSPYADDPVNDAGRAYVFVRSGGVWTQQRNMTAQTPTIGCQFGICVALSADGNTALIGEHARNTATGVAYVWTRSGTTWTYQATLAMSDASTTSTFGFGLFLSSDGNTAVVGARAQNGYRGAAYAYTRSGSVWTQRQKFLASDPASDMNFGRRVAASANCDTLVIAGHGRNDYTGAVYYYTRSGNTWTQQQIITAPDAASSTSFGVAISLSLDGNTLAVGAYGVEKMYIFTRVGGVFVHKVTFSPTVPATSLFGFTASLSDNGMTLAASGYSFNTETGRSFIYEAL